LKVEVEVKEDKVLKFFDILNALKDDYIVDFNAPFVDSLEKLQDVEYESEAGSIENKSTKEGIFCNN